MGTHTSITISGPRAAIDKVKLGKLPGFSPYGDEPAWDYAQDYDHTQRRMVEASPRRIITQVESKWSPEGTAEWATTFTRKRPTLTVEVLEEWDNRDADEPGSDRNVYMAGEWIAAQSKVNGEVPYDLAEIITEAKAALTALEASYSQPSGTQRATDRLVTVVERFIAGLS